MTTENREARLRPNKIIVSATIQTANIPIYKNRLDAFFRKNRLKSQFKYHLSEDRDKGKSVVIATVPNIRVANKISRILKLIAHRQRHPLKVSTTSGVSFEEFLRLMKNV